MRRVVNATMAGILLLAGACSDDDGSAAPDPTVPTSATTSSAQGTTVAADPFAVPPTIDAAYVDRVLVELNRVYGDVVRKIRATGRYERSDLDPLRAIFNDPLLEQQITLFAEIPARDPKLYKEPIGDRTIQVQELYTARPDCVYARALFDASAVAAKPAPPNSKYITLRPTQSGANPGGINPTPWSMSGESDALENRCDGS